LGVRGIGVDLFFAFDVLLVFYSFFFYFLFLFFLVFFGLFSFSLFLVWFFYLGNDGLAVVSLPAKCTQNLFGDGK